MHRYCSRSPYAAHTARVALLRSMHVPTPPPNAEAMTPAERLAYLRSRGVEVDVVRDMT